MSTHKLIPLAAAVINCESCTKFTHEKLLRDKGENVPQPGWWVEEAVVPGIARFAESERQGKEVALDVVDSLVRVRQQIRDAEQQVENQKLEQVQLRQQFDVTIGRLKEITGK
jgi:hypothetical protein